MTDWKMKWEETLKELEQKRDELRVQAHLAKAEAKDELVKMETRVDDLKARAAKAGDEAQDVMEDLARKAGIIKSELKDSIMRIKERMKSEETA